MKILVVIEKYLDEIQKVSKELVSKAREIADDNDGEVISLIISDNDEGVDNLFHHGSNKVITVLNNSYKKFDLESYTVVLSKIIKKYNPDAVFIGATPNGRDLAARTTAKLSLGLVADCIDIKFNDGKFNFIRPTFDGKLNSAIYCSTKPEFATVSSKTFKESNIDTSRKGETIDESSIFEKTSGKVSIEEISENSQIVDDIENANIIVACGRGAKTKEDIDKVKEFAKSIGASFAVSRPLVQKGLASDDVQIGITGKTVSPKLYIALGISGAIQHTRGMENSDLIIAVNNNPDAPIFDVAHYSVVGDMYDAIPLLQAKFNKLDKIV